MKPTKCKVYCRDSRRIKMLFETEKKALTFIKFNGDEIKLENGYTPVRAYKCISCCGWHLTSNRENTFSKSPSEYFIEQYSIHKKWKETNKLFRQSKREQLKIK
jgi:hypothetical protein